MPNMIRQRASGLIILLLAIFTAAADGQQRLLVIGGGARPPEAMKRFVEWSGGERSRILVVTWASGVPDESFASLKKNFEDAGAGMVIHAPIRPLDEEKARRFKSVLRESTGVFFSGGDQNRIMDVLSDEELLRLVREKYAAGTPFGGTSAGAAVMSDPMITGEADLKILDGKKVGVRKGLGLVPNVIFDQHFLVRQRHNRLFGLIMENPKMLGIGIDEDTAVLIEDNRRLMVMGKTQVMFVSGRAGQLKIEVSILKAGDSYNLGKRKGKAAK
ncbi:MAG: cyanophycinase [Pyrinomonadaceae bacterium]